MAEIYNATIVPAIFVLLLISVVIQGLIFWQMERTWRVASFLSLFSSLTLLYLVSALALPLFWREVGRIGVAIGLLGSNWFRGRELAAFLIKKDTVVARTEPKTKTLVDLTKHDEPVTLDATESGTLASTEKKTLAPTGEESQQNDG